MKSGSISRRVLLKSSTAVAAGLVLSPAIVGRAEAATMKMKCSSSLPNDPKYANGRVYYDNLVKHLKRNGLGEAIEVTFFPDNQLGQEIDVINSVKLGVIDLMLSGQSRSPRRNLRPWLSVHELPAADQGVRGRGCQADRGCAAEGRKHPHHLVGL
jgi:TRAP-type transport system periplasmic protein